MNLASLTLSAARDALARHEITSLALTDFFLERIAQHNATTRTFITVTAEQARIQAQRADDERARGISRGALHGIPLALKDLIDQRGVPTTGGSRMLRDNVATRDAEITTRLQDAGAVLLGKTNLHEFAFGVTNENPHYGSVPNPWNSECIPGGSSGGSAAAVSARLCLGALGTDTGGSIRIPASLCGVTGIKPTYGRVSLRGLIPLSWSNDHAGPLAQTAQDCALLLNTLAGYDAGDPASVNIAAPDFTQALNESVRGLRFALPQDYFVDDVDAQVLRRVQEAARLLEELGAVRVEKNVAFAEELFQMNRVILRSEAWTYHCAQLQTHEDEYGADVVKRLREGENISMPQYVEARRRQAELIRALEEWFADVDWMLVPTTRIAAPRMGTNAVAMAGHLTAFTAPFDVTGFPAISLPCGFTSENLPIGLQIVGPRWREDLILRAAHQYQLVTDWHGRIPSL